MRVNERKSRCRQHAKGNLIGGPFENASRLYYSGLAATHVGLALLCHAMWATALNAMRRWFVQPWRRRLLQALTGIALLALAIQILIS
jgi:threonine/homoserine/homoserine lactone efflux protein